MDDLRSYASVRRWIAGVDRYYRLADAEWAERLEALRRFCAEAGRDPDAIVRDAVEQKSEKVDLMRLSKKVARDAAPDDPRAAHDLDNVIRSFFIHNGARVVVRPYED